MMEDITDHTKLVEGVEHSQLTTNEHSKHYDFEEEIEALYASIPEVENHFTITNKIGEGSFSSVYLARLRHHPEVNEMFALKHIIPTTHPSRIENELRCLINIGGHDNVMGVELCMRNRDNVVIVMPIFPHEKFQEYLHHMDLDETREYMKNLLIALKRVHHFHVIHRDIKPSNFLYNRLQKQYALVDFGLATGEFLIDRETENIGRAVAGTKPKVSTSNSAPSLVIKPRMPLSPSKREAEVINAVSVEKPRKCGGIRNKKKVSHNPATSSSNRAGLCSCLGKPKVCSLCVARSNQVAPRAGTAGFRPPEVLMKSPDQGTAVDIWAAGVIFLSILSARYPFFRAEDDMGHLSQIISLLGSDVFIRAAADFGKVLTLSENIPPIDLKSACMKLRLSQMSQRLGHIHQGSAAFQSWTGITDEPFDLLYKMLDPNPKTRISAEEALNHPFFRVNDS